MQHYYCIVERYIELSYISPLIKSFKDKKSEDLFNGTNSKEARTIPSSIWNVDARKMDQLNAAAVLDDLKAPPGNRLEALSGILKGFHIIRVNDQYRIVFRWTPEGPELVEDTDCH